ncbi:MAG: metallophosphoesterase [Luteolibacter sp.]
MNTRRQFLKTALVVSATYPLPLLAAGSSAKKIRIGMITDIHKDLVPDADERLKAFMAAMDQMKPDAIMQLGDFCQPKPANRAFTDIFNAFTGPKYHVLGNHDMDGGFKREQTMAFWGMQARYYSFDLGGFHFIVLDGNDRPAGWKGGYPHYLADDQVAWLKEDLEKTKLSTFIFSHQSFERPMCIDNQEAVRAILEAAKTPDGKRKVAACFNGHWHIDHERVINSIPYIHVNSASYYYMGGNWKKGKADPELAKTFPLYAYNAGYKKPIFTLLEIDPAAGTFVMRGMKGEWDGPSPQELGYKSDEVENDWLKPSITEVKERIS